MLYTGRAGKVWKLISLVLVRPTKKLGETIVMADWPDRASGRLVVITINTLVYLLILITSMSVTFLFIVWFFRNLYIWFSQTVDMLRYI